jgi:hypothetical protein
MTLLTCIFELDPLPLLVAPHESENEPRYFDLEGNAWR